MTLETAARRRCPWCRSLLAPLSPGDVVFAQALKPPLPSEQRVLHLLLGQLEWRGAVNLPERAANGRSELGVAGRELGVNLSQVRGLRRQKDSCVSSSDLRTGVLDGLALSVDIA